MTSNTNDATYANGYHPSVLKAHSWRTPDNTCQYLLPKLKELVAANPDFRLLDVGCGSGSITTGLARYFPRGTAIGLDISEEPLNFARAIAEQQHVENVSFQTGSVYELPFEDNFFDVVHTSQVIIWLTDRTAAIKELLRVTKPGGVVGIREGIMDAVAIHPSNPLFDVHFDLMKKQLQSSVSDIHTGKELRTLASEAGVKLENVKSSSSSYTWANEEDRRVNGESIVQRVLQSNFASFAESQGVPRQQLEEIAQAYRDWMVNPEGFFAMLQGEIIITKV